MAFLAPFIPLIIGGAAVGTAAFAAGGGFSKAPGLPALRAAPAKPSPGDAEKKAKKTTEERRKTLLRTGGKTTFTTPLGATVPEDNVNVKTLLG